MNIEDLIRLDTEYGSSNKDMVTDVIDSGITIVYGEAGVGKTISTIKNLNRYDINPLMLDFDRNTRDISGVEVRKVDGRFFIENFEAQINKSDFDKLEERMISKFNSVIEEHTNKDLQYGAITFKRLKNSTIDSYDYIKKHHLLSEEHLKQAEKIILNEDDSKSKEEHIENEIILIDTYATAMYHFDNDITKFSEFVKKLEKRNNNIILIAHSHGERGREVDVERVFANACDAKLRLERSQTRTKETTYTLFIEKLRGDMGKDKIENWER